MLHTAVYGDSGLSRFYTNVFTVMAIGLVITAISTWLISSSPGVMASLFHLTETIEDGKTVQSFSASPWWYAAVIIELVLVWMVAGGSLLGTRSTISNLILFVFYCALNGVTLAPAIYAYTAASVTWVFLITAGMFGGCALWGVLTKRNLLPLGTFFMAGLIGLLIVLVVNIFYTTPAIDTTVSCVAVLLFAGLTAFDMQKLREMYREERGNTAGLVIYGAITLYLDFINMFLHLLRLFGVKKD